MALCGWAIFVLCAVGLVVEGWRSYHRVGQMQFDLVLIMLAACALILGVGATVIWVVLRRSGIRKGNGDK